MIIHPAAARPRRRCRSNPTRKSSPPPAPPSSRPAPAQPKPPVPLLDRPYRGIQPGGQPQPLGQLRDRHQPRVLGQPRIRRPHPRSRHPTPPATSPTPYPLHLVGVPSTRADHVLANTIIAGQQGTNHQPTPRVAALLADSGQKVGPVSARLRTEPVRPGQNHMPVIRQLGPSSTTPRERLLLRPQTRRQCSGFTDTAATPRQPGPAIVAPSPSRGNPR